MRTTLALIQSFTDDAEKKLITDSTVKTWLKELEAVAFDADNVLDELNYHVLAKKMKKITMETEKKKVPSCFPSFTRCSRRRRMALKVKEINMTFESTNKKATELGLERRLADARVAPNVGLETDSFTVDPIFIGRDNDVSKIVEILTTTPTEQVFSILPIVGMGGLGKTTLTRNVFNHEKMKTHFGEQIWVHVSTNFDPVSLLKKILTTLTPSKDDEVGCREVILKKLQEALSAKTYLLVLDDVWNQDQLKWDDFMNSLSGISSARGNGIIVTTRNAEVASIVQTLPIYELKGLPADNCWSIIKAKAFGGGDIRSGFEIIGRNIAKRCQGLPLAAYIVGGVLRGKSADDWRSIERNWLPDENNISNILKLSFDNLYSPALKKCFAYCAIFPKGYWIRRQELIELWMAEGFLQPDQDNDMGDVGNKFFDLLLQNSLFQIALRDDYGNISASNMHDLVHDLACSVLGSCKVNDSISDSICQVRYRGPRSDGDKSIDISKEAKYLRTLFFEGEISNSLISRFECLHALTLKGDHITELPSSIKKLLHLRYLDIAKTKIEYLPDSIGELYLLQTLRTTGEYYFEYHLKKLPSTFKYLISLRHLYIHARTEFPREVGRLTSLQVLPFFPVGKEKGQQIIELGGLKDLKGTLEIRNLEKVHGKEEAEGACLSQKPNLVELVLCWNESREGEPNDENVLESLQPHPNLKRLRIKGFKGTSFPLWTLKMAVRDGVEGRWIGLDNLTKIALNGCNECEEIPMLGHLPHLQSLDLKNLTKVRCIGSSFYGIDNRNSKNKVPKETIIAFPALRSLELWKMPNLTEWVEMAVETDESCEVKVFPCLEYLEIKYCKQLISAPSHFPGLKELDIYEMDSSLPLANICGSKLISLTKLFIGKLDGLVCLPDWLFFYNKNLSLLEIRNCPNLRELPNGLQTLNSLEELSIDGCPNLKSIPSCSSSGESQGLTSSLLNLPISDCQGLINLPCEMIESSAPSLKTLTLRDLRSVTNFPTDCLVKMSRLETLEIDNVHQFFSGIEIGNLGSLRVLTIGPFSDSTDCSSFNKFVDGILLQLKSQSHYGVSLRGMEDWDSLPNQLQHLTALSDLQLKNFGIETLPEWFGNLSSLRRLTLIGCKKLRSMPSKEAMQRLTKLGCLSIQDCPELEERCRFEKQSDDSDSEWPKISHINLVNVGRHYFIDGEQRR